MRARDVMGAVVDEERMTWRNGWRMVGASTEWISATDVSSARRADRFEQMTDLCNSSGCSADEQKPTGADCPACSDPSYHAAPSDWR